MQIRANEIGSKDGRVDISAKIALTGLKDVPLEPVVHGNVPGDDNVHERTRQLN